MSKNDLEPLSFSKIREKAGYSLQQLSEETGKSLRTLYRWENDEIKEDKFISNYFSQR